MTDARAGALTVEQALIHVLEGTVPIRETRSVDLLAAHGCVLAAPLFARHTQPPFAASAMDGYAARSVDLTTRPTTLQVVGEAAAGHGFAGVLGAGQAVRIFTGAPVPTGADAIVIQEDTRRDGDMVTVIGGVADADHIRPSGGDFVTGQPVIAADTRLMARHIALAAAAGHDQLTVRRAPRVAIVATGDELVLPGQLPRSDQIVCSNPFGVAAMVSAAGGAPRLLGIAHDTHASLEAAVAQAADCDILVTLGGASVGDHDLVGPVLTGRGMAFAFWKLAMRPGKPMLFGRLGAQRVLGLPGNPVSSMITARLFLVPLIRALLGVSTPPTPVQRARLTSPLGANGARAHYMRAALTVDADGGALVRPLTDQDSSLLMPLAEATCLIVRPIDAPAMAAGAHVAILLIDF